MSLTLGKSTWKRVALGDVVRNINETVRDPAAAGIDRIIALDHMDPAELKIRRCGSAEDGTTFTRRVKPGQTLFGKRRAYQRKVGYAEFDAVCSGDIYTFEADETRLLGEFLPFLAQSDAFFRHALATSAGSLSPRTSWRDLAALEFDLPPLDEQQRLASLFWSVEQHRQSLKAQSDQLALALTSLLNQRFARATGRLARIVDLCTAVVGGVWGSPEGENEVDVLALGPKVYASGATELSPHDSPTRSISINQARSRVIQEGDIILERSGGSPDQPVGRVVLAGAGLSPCIPTDFQRLLRPSRDLVVPGYLFWKLRLDWLNGLTRGFSKRTTNITNLSVSDYLAREITVPSRDEQMCLLSDVQVFRSAISTLADEQVSATTLRASLSAAIFGAVDGSV